MMLMLLMYSSVVAQKKPAQSLSFKGQKAVYVEVGGNGLLGSLNFEQFVTDNMAIRAGAMFFPLHYNPIFTGSIMAVWVKGKKNKPVFLESGVGIGVFSGEAFGDDHLTIPYLTVSLGIRYQPKPKGILLRAGVSTFYWYPWAGVSIGYTF